MDHFVFTSLQTGIKCPAHSIHFPFIPIESPWRMLPLNVNPDVTRVAIHDLVPGWTYQFRLQAFNKVGYGPNSQATERIFLPEESPGEPPQHIFIHEILSTSLDVRWLPPPYRYRHGKIRGYLIRYQPVGLSGEFQVQNVSGGDKTSFILVDLLQWAAYEVAVAAYTAIGPGPYSPSSTSWTLQGAPRVPPRDVKAEVISSTSIKLSWLPPSPDTIPGIILGYKVSEEREM
uniref:Fibronectin type-III domain-containing protein n=1 Tax=Eptatretus burgeri TaxID=7764 RepID=A0A8C4QAQ1_EPTBU